MENAIIYFRASAHHFPKFSFPSTPVTHPHPPPTLQAAVPVRSEAVRSLLYHIVPCTGSQPQPRGCGYQSPRG